MNLGSNKNKIRQSKAAKNTSMMSIVLIVVVFIFVKFIGGNENLKEIQSGDLLQVNFINVGQGDSILIKNPQNEFMLIDTGTSDQYDTLRAYLNSEKVEKFAYVIFTHPHADHIGSADKIIKEYDVETVIMPRATTNTATFARLLDELEAKRIGITPAEAGDEYIFGTAKFLIVAPMKEDYGNLNDHSVVVKMLFGNNTFLFTGDMEKTSEDDVLDFCERNGENIISADLLKVAHHGSATSSTKKFLELVKPKIAVILSDGKSYGHPHADVLERLDNIGALIARSDLHGNIVVSSDGRTLSIESEIVP